MKFKMSSIKETPISYCPLCINLRGWRQSNDLNFMTEEHLCPGKKRIPEGLKNHLVQPKNGDILHKASHYYLMRLELMWNNHKKNKTIDDTKCHGSSHTRK